MRLYSFVNMYLSGPHIGIQTAHAVAELFLKYHNNKDLALWAEDHKTIICLNGGDSINMMTNLLDIEKMDYPCAPFFEKGLSDALTAYAVILPEIIYKTAKEFRENGISRFDLNNSRFDKNELALIDIINSCALAK